MDSKKKGSSMGTSSVMGLNKDYDQYTTEEFPTLLEKKIREAKITFLDPKDFAGFKDQSNFLGAGNFGSVYRAKKDGKEYAIKQMAKFTCRNDVMIRMICRELEALNLLNHDQILKIHGVFIEEAFDKSTEKEISIGKQLFIVYNLIDGKDFLKFLEENVKDKDTNLSYEIKLDLAIQMASIVTYVHENDIVHRDIKPDNFMIVEKDNKKTLILVDFGFAKIVNADKIIGDVFSDEVKQTGTAKGTPRYSPPETNEDVGDDLGSAFIVTTKFDVWSLGGVILYLFTGDEPFRRTKDDKKLMELKLFQEKIDKNVYGLEEVNGKKIFKILRYPEINDILDKCFQLELDDRCSSKELLELLIEVKNNLK